MRLGPVKQHGATPTWVHDLQQEVQSTGWRENVRGLWRIDPWIKTDGWDTEHPFRSLCNLCWVKHIRAHLYRKNSCSATKLSDKARLCSFFPGSSAWGGMVVRSPPSVLRCPSLFPHLSCCITALSQRGPYTRRRKKKGTVVLYLQWIIWNRHWKGFF